MRLHIKRNNVIQDLVIDEGCSEIESLDQERITMINKLIGCVYKILNKRLEMKNAPKTNVHYE